MGTFFRQLPTLIRKEQLQNDYLAVVKIGIALSGGGARGIAHIGVLKALEEMGVEIAVISGTSAGSIVASLYAQGLKPDQIFQLVAQLSLRKSVRPAWSMAGLFTMDGVRDLILKNIPGNNFSTLKIPLTIAATDLRKGEAVYFNSGELATAVVSSCSIPVVFNPVSLNGNVYADGGLLDNLPARCIRHQCDFLIGSHCNEISKEFDPKNFKNIIERSLLIAIYANTQQSKNLCNLSIAPPNMDRFTVFDIGKAKEIFEAGYQFTKSNFIREHFQK
ncbi:MAG: patatin-like phospholipase family protein [Bacteroidetes bacterium]|nr:patatin-like phospholipase family protein [Bacteroidota bacterium]MBS1541170.1 patatin-like phospholipase family protein [Bacteroidota bacterium]